jgi:hypothetical protein
MFILSCALSVHAKRTIAVLKIKRGPGASTKNAEFFWEKVERALTAGGLFDVKTTAPLHALVEKLGGCKKAKCYYSAAREVGLNLLVTGTVRKRRDDYIAILEIIDTEFGEPVLELSDKLPGDIMRVSDKWVAGFLSQLEYLTVAAEEMEVLEAEETEEAAKATLIMQDEVSGRFTLEKSPYLIVRNIIVPAGQILEIDSGVKILISGDRASIVVFGQMVANGTKAHPVLFKSARKDAKAGDWDRLYVRSATRSYFTHCAVSACTWITATPPWRTAVLPKMPWGASTPSGPTCGSAAAISARAIFWASTRARAPWFMWIRAGSGKTPRPWSAIPLPRSL